MKGHDEASIVVAPSAVLGAAVLVGVAAYEHIKACQDGGAMWGAISVGIIGFVVLSSFKLVQSHRLAMLKSQQDHEIAKQHMKDAG